MDALKRAVLRFERALSSGRPPSRYELWAIRHPLLCAMGVAVLVGMSVSWALSAFTDPTYRLDSALIGLGVGALIWICLRVQRWVNAQNFVGYETPPRIPGS